MDPEAEVPLDIALIVLYSLLMVTGLPLWGSGSFIKKPWRDALKNTARFYGSLGSFIFFEGLYANLAIGIRDTSEASTLGWSFTVSVLRFLFATVFLGVGVWTILRWRAKIGEHAVAAGFYLKIAQAVFTVGYIGMFVAATVMLYTDGDPKTRWALWLALHIGWAINAAWLASELIRGQAQDGGASGLLNPFARDRDPASSAIPRHEFQPLLAAATIFSIRSITDAIFRDIPSKDATDKPLWMQEDVGKAIYGYLYPVVTGVVTMLVFRLWLAVRKGILDSLSSSGTDDAASTSTAI